MSVKKIFTTLAIALATLTVNTSSAQKTEPCTCKQPSPEAELLSSKHENGATTTRWLVPAGTGCMSKVFYISYPMSIATISPKFKENQTELNKLNDFIASADSSQLMRIRSIDITGYASPDGVQSYNEQLAKKRAESLRSYITKHCCTEGCKGNTKGVALQWSKIESDIESSNIPSKQSIITLVESNEPQSEIENNLRKNSNWNYIRTTILPTMRCVDVAINYDAYQIVVTQTPDVVIETVEVEKIGRATVATVDEVVVADSPFDNKAPQIVNEQEYIVVINRRNRSDAEFRVTPYPPLDF